MSQADPTAPTAEEMRRLTLIRYLYGLGLEQSRSPEPVAVLSLLPFHDSAESFLQLASERLQLGENKSDFMNYWTIFLAGGVSLPHRESMRRLNAARRGLKHQGILPSKHELEGLRAATTNFLSDSALLIFGVSFEEIRQTNLIMNDSIREKLEAAYAALEQSNFVESMNCAAIAFILTRRAHSAALASAYPRHSALSVADLAWGIRSRGFGGRDPIDILSEQLGRLKETFGEVIELVGYGLSFEDYMLFKAHVPVVHEFIGGHVSIEWTRGAPTEAAPVKRCIDFVAESALRLRV